MIRERTGEALKKICCMSGAEEVKQFARRLANAACHTYGFRPPDVLLLADEGAGVTHCLKLLTGLLHELLPVDAFMGEEDLFEWCIEDDENSFQQLLLRVRQAGGFYGVFRGVIGLDLRPMLAQAETLPDLRRLMTFVREQQRIVFVFVAPQDLPPGMAAALKEELMVNTVVETVTLPMPDKETAAAYLLRRLQRQGLVGRGGVEEAAQAAAARLIASERFSGFRSLDTLAQEVVWRKMAQDGKSSLLCAKDFDGLTGTGKTTPGSAAGRRKIGFGQNR